MAPLHPGYFPFRVQESHQEGQWPNIYRKILAKRETFLFIPVSSIAPLFSLRLGDTTLSTEDPGTECKVQRSPQHQFQRVCSQARCYMFLYDISLLNYSEDGPFAVMATTMLASMSRKQYSSHGTEQITYDILVQESQGHVQIVPAHTTHVPPQKSTHYGLPQSAPGTDDVISHDQHVHNRHLKDMKGELSLCQQILRNPEEFCFDEQQHQSSASNKEVANRTSFIIESRLHQADNDHPMQAIELLAFARSNCKDMLVLSLNKIWPSITLPKMFKKFLVLQFDSEVILVQACHSQSTQIKPTIRMEAVETTSMMTNKGCQEPCKQSRFKVISTTSSVPALAQLYVIKEMSEKVLGDDSNLADNTVDKLYTGY